jgi:DNA gyrase subunit A
MIINKSGITICFAVAGCRVMSRGTQGVKLIDLKKKNDYIASVCKVMHVDEDPEEFDDAEEVDAQDAEGTAEE